MSIANLTGAAENWILGTIASREVHNLVADMGVGTSAPPLRAVIPKRVPGGYTIGVREDQHESH